MKHFKLSIILSVLLGVLVITMAYQVQSAVVSEGFDWQDQITVLDGVVDDMTELRTKYNAAQVDLAEVHTKLNALIGILDDAANTTVASIQTDIVAGTSAVALTSSQAAALTTTK